MRRAFALLLICGLAQHGALAQNPLENILNTPVVAGAGAAAAAAANAALSDISGLAGDVASTIGAFGTIPKLGAIQATLRSLTVNIISTLASLNTAGQNAKAGAAAGSIDTVVTALKARAEEARNLHMALIGEAGKAVSGGASALATAAAPLRQPSLRLLSLDATVGNLHKLKSFMEGLSTYLPDAKRELLEPSTSKLQSVADNLTALKEAMVQGPGAVIDAVGHALGSLGLPDSYGAADFGSLLDNAVTLISGALPKPLL